MLKKTPRPHSPSLPSSGFTIIEVILGSALTMIVVTVAGMGLVNMLRNDYKSSAESDIRNNLNRVTEFISSETKQAQKIVSSQTRIRTSNIPEDRPLPSNARVILALELPKHRDQIIYYTTPSQSPWMPPRVLHRWGPPLDRNGNYVVAQESGQVVNTNWSHSALTDMLAEADAVPDKDCDGWNRVPVENDYVDGFFVCVNSAENLVRLRLAAEVELTSSEGGQPEKAVYSTDTKIFARLGSEDLNPTSGRPLPYRFGPLPAGLDGQNVLPQPRNDDGVVRVSANDIGGQCRSDCSISTPSSVRDLYQVPATDIPARRGDYVGIVAGTVRSYLGNTNRQSVQILTNRDSLPNGVTLADNQVLFILTELRGRQRSYQIVVTLTN